MADTDTERRYQKPYGNDRPVPSIAKYREAKEARKNDDEPIQDTSETFSGDVKQKRKAMRKEDRAGRIVTDPITHLPVKIHDFTNRTVESITENSLPYGSTPQTSTGRRNKEKGHDQLRKELEEIARGQATLQAEFPPPAYEAIQEDLVRISKHSIFITFAGTVLVSGTLFFLQLHHYISAAIVLISSILLFIGTAHWADRRIKSLWEGAVWRGKFNADVEEQTETTVWMNSLLSAVWPLINPDLFTSLADTFEDVMQASLPSIVRMISVDDIGQGSESWRILGIRWLPTAAAARSVGVDGDFVDKDDEKEPQIQPQAADEVTRAKSKKEQTDEDGQAPKTYDDEADDDDEQASLPGEDGEFVNLEVAFAYRATSSGHSFKDRIKDMHLCLTVYLPGGIKLPIWADLRGAIGVMRLRLQLSPDPPFFAQCTLTLLGQPKVEISCVPLLQGGFNIMNLPIINNFVQASIDAAVSEYVAPKSLTLDLKDMISGDDFKKDVETHGVLVVKIIRGYDFKSGDIGVPLISAGGADPYVTVGWAKFGKPLWSTRILESQMEPDWHETTYVLVTPQELHVDERLRIQLWDSDRFTADDDLGRIEVDVKQLMKKKGKQMRCDGFRALKAGKSMPGKLEWEVEYCPKIEIQPDQMDKQTFSDTNNIDELNKKVDEIARDKLKELPEQDRQLEKQKRADRHEEEREMSISAPPPEHYLSGVLSIQIHQIAELELQKLNVEQEEEEDLPSAYCSIIVNHEKVYETRTKPKNARPFFNAATERFIPDWRSAEVHISVRDARIHEDHPLIGIVHLPLGELFEERTQRSGFWPISGGIGYGRIRLSFVWRSIKFQAPPKMLGWHIGTAEVHEIRHNIDELSKLKMKVTTNLKSAKMRSDLILGFHQRYSSAITIRFRDKNFTGAHTQAFAILWLREVPDDDETEVEVPVLKGDFTEAMKSAEPTGDKIGTLTVRLTLWAGLGPAHRKWAKKTLGVRDVLEVLDTSRDNMEDSEAEKRAGIIHKGDTDDDDDDDTSSSDDDPSVKPPADANGDAGDHSATPADESPDGPQERGAISNIVSEIKDYKENHTRIHRHNRGVMTWKAPRTAKWAKHNAEKLENKISGVFKRHSRHLGVESEA